MVLQNIRRIHQQVHKDILFTQREMQSEEFWDPRIHAILHQRHKQSHARLSLVLWKSQESAL